MTKLAAGFLCAAAVFAADPELLRLAMPEARILAGADVAKVKHTPFGRFAVAQFSSAQDPQYDAFVKASGFDPIESLDEILLAKPDTGDTRLVLARGRFDTARIIEAAGAAGAGAARYRGVPVLVSPQAWLAFLSGSIAAMGDAASVRVAVERRETGAGPPKEIAARAEAASKAYAIWFVIAVPPAELMARLPGAGAIPGALLGLVREARGGVNFGDSVWLSAELTTATAEDAANLAAVLKVAAGAIARAPAEVAIDGSTVKIRLALSEPQIEALWKQAE
jgi:hypothetical protein